MTCIGRKGLGTPSFDEHALHQENSSFESSFSVHLSRNSAPDFSSPGFQRERRPALIPPNSSLTLAEAQELVGNRINRPLFPPPDPKLINKLNPWPGSSSAQSPSPPTPQAESKTHLPPEWAFLQEESTQAAARSLFPTSSAIDVRRRSLWLKARVHRERDREARLEAAKAQSAKPKRKHSAFVLDEERKCLREDVVGTPHLSEMGSGDDMPGEIDVEVLGVRDAAAMEVLEGKLAEVVHAKMH